MTTAFDHFERYQQFPEYRQLRLLGTVLVVAASELCLGVRQMKMDRTSRGLTAALLLAIAAQYALGVLMLIRFVPIGFAVAHQTMAMVIVGFWAWAMHHVRHLVVAPVTR